MVKKLMSVCICMSMCVFFVSFHSDLIVCPLMHLQKLPFTIPELVQSAPCRSSDGILYTGECVFV